MIDTNPNRHCLVYFFRLSFLVLVSITLALPKTQAAQSDAIKATPKRPVSTSSSKNSAGNTASPASLPVQKAKEKNSKATQKKIAQNKAPASAAARPLALSEARKAGLHEVYDPLGLSSAVAYVVDKNTGKVLLSKNEGAILPIASLTKIMTATVTIEAMLPMNEVITIHKEDIDTLKHSRSRLPVDARVTRQEALRLMLMSSENRAAHALARTWPGGRAAFVARMNARAQQLGMHNSQFADASGLSPQNRSTARDLVRLVLAANRIPLMRELTTAQQFDLDLGKRTISYNNSNALVRNKGWDEIGFQKTGFINESGSCLVLQLEMTGRDVILVLLDASSSDARVADVKRVHAWLERQTLTASSSTSTRVKDMDGR